MKTLKIYASAFVLMLAFTVSSQATPHYDVNVDKTEVKTEPIKKQIDPANLPAAVKDAIENGDFADWKISKAYQITYEEKSEDMKEKVEYEVHFENAKKEKEIELFDKEGSAIDND